MDNNKSLIKFPSIFTIKVIGSFNGKFLEEIYNLVYPFDHTLKKSEIKQTLGKNNNYISLTLNISAISKEQLDNIYKVINSHSMVKFVL